MHIKKCWASLAMSEIQIKVTLRLHFTLFWMPKINYTGDRSCWRGCGVRGGLLLLVWIRPFPLALTLFLPPLLHSFLSPKESNFMEKSHLVLKIPGSLFIYMMSGCGSRHLLTCCKRNLLWLWLSRELIYE